MNYKVNLRKMASSDDPEVQRWWGTLNKMSRAEVYFRQTLYARKELVPGRAMIIRSGSPSQWSSPMDIPSDLGPRDLIVLEDLSRSSVEALGPRLGIPVSVFALHWANPIDHVNSEVRVPIGESPDRHFILNYRQSLPFSILDRNQDIAVKGLRAGQFWEMRSQGFCC